MNYNYSFTSTCSFHFHYQFHVRTLTLIILCHTYYTYKSQLKLVCFDVGKTLKIKSVAFNDLILSSLCDIFIAAMMLRFCSESDNHKNMCSLYTGLHWVSLTNACTNVQHKCENHLLDLLKIIFNKSICFGTYTIRNNQYM